MRHAWQCRLLLPGLVVLATTVMPMHVLAGDASSAHDAPVKQFWGTDITQANTVVFAIDRGSNSIALLSDNGLPVNVVVDRSLGDVGNLRLGETINVTFSRALLLRAEKRGSNGIRERVDKEFSTAPSLGSSLSLHRVEAVATVVRIERDKRQLTLRGPTQTVTLQASSDQLLYGLAIGDSVRVDYIEATAVQITRDGVPLRGLH